MTDIQMEIRPGEEFMLEGVAGYLSQYKGPLKTVLDIGAHVGELSILAASRGAKYVWAIEPDLENYKALCCNIEKNLYDTVIIAANIAVAKDIGHDILRKPEGGNTGQRSIRFHSGYQSYAMIGTVPLNWLIDKFEGNDIDFMKMDIEGAEHEVIQSTPPAILRYIRYIDLDLHNLNFLDYYSGGCDPEDTLNYIIKAGFKLLSRSGDEKAFHVAMERV